MWLASKQKPHLCIGGPLDGQRKTSHEIGIHDSELYAINKQNNPNAKYLHYVQYNCAGGSGLIESCVWVWREIVTLVKG